MKTKELESTRILDTEIVEQWISTTYDVRESLSIDVLVTFLVIDNCDLNKKLFLVYDGALRQFKIKKQLFFPYNYGVPKAKSAILIEICGIGEVWVVAENACYVRGYLPFDCFATIKDYKESNPYEVNYLTFTSADLVTIFFNRGICNFNKTYSSYIAHLYKWDGVKCVTCKVNNNVNLSMLWDGHLVVNLDKAEHPYYVTEEECAENNSLKVECFAEEEEEKEDKAQNVVVRCTYEIKGTLYEVVDGETLAKIKKLLNF